MITEDRRRHNHLQSKGYSLTQSLLKFELHGVIMQTFRILLGQPMAKLLPSVSQSKILPALSGDRGSLPCASPVAPGPHADDRPHLLSLRLLQSFTNAAKLFAVTTVVIGQGRPRAASARPPQLALSDGNCSFVLPEAAENCFGGIRL